MREELVQAIRETNIDAAMELLRSMDGAYSVELVNERFGQRYALTSDQRALLWSVYNLIGYVQQEPLPEPWMMGEEEPFSTSALEHVARMAKRVEGGCE